MKTDQLQKADSTTLLHTKEHANALSSLAWELVHLYRCIINLGPKEQPELVELALQLLHRLFQANHFCDPCVKRSVVTGSPVVNHSIITRRPCTTPHQNIAHNTWVYAYLGPITRYYGSLVAILSGDWSETYCLHVMWMPNNHLTGFYL